MNGKVFTRLTVLRDVGRNKWGEVIWECLCDCGKLTTATTHILNRGDKKSCGCLGKGGKKNCVGNTYGKLTALYEIGKINKSESIYYFCKCDCGNTREVSGDCLRSGDVVSCGCTKNKKRLVGKRFGKLVVESEHGRSSNGCIIWNCVCDCGKRVTRMFVSLHESSSCGCAVVRLNQYTPPIKDISGHRFGKLTAIKISGKSHGKYKWECLCDCGNTVSVLVSALTGGKTKSCGCILKVDRTGPNHHNYNPELTDEHRQAGRAFPAYAVWRTEVYRRDSFTCQCCGEVGGKLNAHHLEDYANNPTLRTELSNGVTLCESCHEMFHSIYGKQNRNYKWQFEKFKEQYELSRLSKNSA